VSKEARILPSAKPNRDGCHRPWIVLPVRGESTGKSRLASVLDPIERMRLNRKLLRRTLDVIEAWQGSLRQCLLVSPCARTQAVAQARGASVLEEPMPGRGLNRAVALGVRRAKRLGARRVLILPGDLVLLDAAALRALARHAGWGARAAIARDRAGSGTNALLLPADAHFRFAFGPDSFERHRRSMRLRGWDVAVCDEPRLCFDLDTAADLADLPDRVPPASE
jgi:2-phospho-L-lactate guanylyltransferase